MNLGRREFMKGGITCAGIATGLPGCLEPWKGKYEKVSVEELILDPEKYLGEPVTTSGYVWPAEEIPIEEGTSLDLEWLERLGFDLPDRIVLWKEEKEMSMYGISKDPPYGDEIGFTVGEIDHKPVENSLYSPSNRNVKQSEALLKVFGEVDRLSMENICPEHDIYMYFLKAEGAAALQEV